MSRRWMLPGLLAALLAVTALGAAPRGRTAAGTLFLAPSDIEFDRFNETGTLQGSRTVTGLLGGTLQVGRFTVLVPPGAIDGTATVTLVVPDRSELACQLSISPESANNFRLPVTLTASGLGGSITDASQLRMYWYDPSVDGWRDVTTGVDVSNFLVITQLRHFSTYAGGKAGW